MKKRIAFAAAAVLLGLTSSGFAADKPTEIKLGITTFTSGAASVFGVPGKAAAEMIVEDWNKKGGIGGVPVKLFFIDEGAGTQALLSEYRRLVQEEKVDAIFASISSGNCQAVAPLAEDLKILNYMWDCGTQRVLEESKFRYVYRPQSYGTAEMLSSVLYLLRKKPDLKTIAVVNQDYAWGRDSWQLFSTALMTLKPDVKVVAELFPKLGAADFSTEISRLQALKPDVILSTSWGGDLDTFVRQSNQRGLIGQSLFVLPLAESSLERLGADLPEGVIVGARGDNYFLNPEYKDKPDFKAFVEAFRTKTSAYPIYPVWHMAQSLFALRNAYDAAMKANGGQWPSRDQVADATRGIVSEAYSRPIKVREDGQGLADQLLGTTKRDPKYKFSIIDDIAVYPAEKIMPPVGKISVDWLKTLDPSITKIDVATFKHPM
ncbi:MAG: ABC transporter substrate-binding protein [Pseudomonadota bacterium]